MEKALKKVRAKYVRALVATFGADRAEEAMKMPGFLGALNAMCARELEKPVDPKHAATFLAMTFLAHMGVFEPWPET